MYKTDKIDLQIIDFLMVDGRMPCAEIARRIGGISERAVRYRINRMVEEKLIQITAITDPKCAGFSVVADVWLQVEADMIREVARKMAEYANISYVAYAIGETDVSIQVIAHNNEEVYEFVTEVVRKTPGVIKTTTSIVPEILKDVYQWRIPHVAKANEISSKLGSHPMTKRIKP